MAATARTTETPARARPQIIADAVTPDQFESWSQQQRADIEAAGEALGEQRKRRAQEGATE